MCTMFERVASYFLTKYLGWLVKGLDADKLNISIWGGDVVLHDLELQEEALDFLELPVQVKRGYLKTLRLNIPWSSIGSSPSIVELDGLYCVAYPSDQFEYNEEEEKARQSADRSAQLEALNAAEKKDAAAGGGGGGGGYFAGMITKIVQNLKLVISNVHIRLEDKSSDPRHPFAVGMVLQEIRLDGASFQNIAEASIDSRGDELVTKPDGMIRKAFVIKGFAVYFDSDLHEEINYISVGDNDTAEVLIHEMQNLGITDGDGEAEAPLPCTPKHFLVQPVTVEIYAAVDDQMVGGLGAAAYYGTGKLPPAMDVRIDISTFGVKLAKRQYRDLLNCISFFSNHATISKNRKFRPKVQVREDPAKWWHYAYNAVILELREKKKSLRWDKLVLTVKQRKEYIELQKRKNKKYAETFGLTKLSADVAATAQAVRLEDNFAIGEIVEMRKRAEHEVMGELREEKMRCATGVGAAGESQGWVAWMWGSADPEEEEHQDDEEGEFQISKEEKKKFNQLFANGAEQRDKMIAIIAEGSKDRASMILNFKLSSIDVQIGTVWDKSSVMNLKIDSLFSSVKMLNDSTLVNAHINNLHVQDVGSDSAEECLEIVRRPANRMHPMKRAGDNQLLQLSYLTSAAASSDSGAATAHLKLTFRPLDITVSFPFLDGVSAFFAPEEQVNLDNFIFAAAEQAEALRQTSAAKAQDVLSSSSKMLVDVTISPPTILVPADVSWTAEGDGAGSLPGNGHDLMLCVAIGELTIASVEGLVCEEISLSDARNAFSQALSGVRSVGRHGDRYESDHSISAKRLPRRSDPDRTRFTAHYKP